MSSHRHEADPRSWVGAIPLARFRPSDGSMGKPRVLIADEHRLFVAGLERLLAVACDVVSTIDDARTLLDVVRLRKPDLVVLGLSMSPVNGLDRIREIHTVDPGIKIIVVTMSEDPDLAAEAFRRGASAYVLKQCAVSELLDAVQCSIAEQWYVTPLITRGMIEALANPARQRDGVLQLTGRQREVLHLLADGKSMKEVASALHLAVRTVAFHKYRVMHVLRITSNAELVRFAVVHHLA
jgi:DNA-binding NarL/FixJ family response regulator